MAAQLESLLDKTADEGKEEPAHWETEFARLVAERQNICFFNSFIYIL